ncbi:restriction endonuclease subunit S [Mesomycoplasma ovipneumoniae]|uniref:restriction endonuclease subunit S n=1 Tax=Mesomycoplasma ovipneumoniae TaxID=29562 RepID=UPI00311A88AC
MNRYESYKKVNLPWLKEVPSHWEINRVKRYFEITRGRVIPKEELDSNGKYPVYSSQTENYGIMGYLNTYDFDEVDCITWTTDGEKAGTTFLRSGKYNCTNICGILLPKIDKLKDINLAYCNYIIGLGNQHSRRKDTNGYKIMNNEMEKNTILLPPLPEQIQIASYLDWKINEIDRLIQIEKKKIKELNHIKQLSISFEYKKISKKIRLKMLLSEPLLYGINGTGETDGSIRFIRITDINKDGELKENNCQYFDNCENKFLLKKGDILFARSGTVGKSYIHKSENMKMCFAGYLIRARLDTEIVLPEFAYLYTQSADYEKWKESISIQSTIQNISAEKYANLQIPFVDKIEQKNIIQHLRKIINSIEKCKVIISKKIKELESLKQSLISEVVTGKIDVRNVVIPEYEKVTVLDDEAEEFDEMDRIEDGN